MHSRYVVKDGEFTKFGLADTRSEFDKAQALCELASRCGFLSPAVKRYDAKRDSVTYEYLPDLTPIREAYLSYMLSEAEHSEWLGQIAAAGSALAMIHRELLLPNTTKWIPPPEFEAAFDRISDESCASWISRVPWAQAHCDYGFSNVLLGGGSTRKIVVIDPSANGFVTFSTALYAPVYIDIANFVACIEGLVPPRYFLRMRWRRLGQVRDAFLSAYEREADTVLDRTLVSRVAYATAYCYFQREYRNRLISHLAITVLFNRLKRNKLERHS